MSGTTGTIPLQPFVDNELLTKELLNGEFGNISTLMDAAGCGGHSDTDSQTQIQVAPYPGSVLSKATSIAGEFERLRYQIAQILGTDYWYKPTPNGNSLSNIFISGEIKPFAGTSIPTGFLLCDGSSYLNSTYPSLFSAIGTIWGSVDGTHFNVPDLRGKSLYGKDSGALFTNVGSSGGTQNHNHSVPTHSHAVNSHTHTTPDTTHSHTLNSAGIVASVNYTGGSTIGSIGAADALKTLNAAGGETIVQRTASTDSKGSAGTTGATATGTDSVTATTGNANPPYATVLYIIKI